MTKRRTHSVIDKLPEDLRDVLMRMIVDNVWPDDWLGPTDGKPTYDDLVLYCSTQGYVVSRSAIGRWAKRMQVYALMKSAAGIAQNAMQGLSDENATEIQKACAEVITAQIIEASVSNKLTTKQIRDLATATRDCTAVTMKADTYIRDRAKAKADAAVKKITKLATKKQIDPEVLKVIREQVFGIVN